MMISSPVSWLRCCAFASMLFVLGCSEKPNAPQMASSEPSAAAASPAAANPPAAAPEEPAESEEEQDEAFPPPDPAGPEFLDLITPDRPSEIEARGGLKKRLMFDLVGFAETPDYNAAEHLDQTKFVWRQKSGPPMEISDPNSAYASVVLPDVKEPTEAVFEFEFSNPSGKRASSVTVFIVPAKH